MKYFPLLFSLMGMVTLHAGMPAVWEPARTWVFAVGVLQFDDPSWETWPDEGRVDAVLVDAFRARGVPEAQIRFIKNADATKANVVAQFEAFLKLGAPGDTLFFYFTGHGSRDWGDDKRPVSFITYDTLSSWTGGEIVNAIVKNFKGSRVMLTADCCSSGDLAIRAARHPGKFEFGVLTSSKAAAESTGNWTFTQGLVDMLNGSALMDLDGDGSVTFAEASRYMVLDMAFAERQRACHWTMGGFPAGLVFSQAPAKASARVGERLMAWSGDKWKRVKILEESGGQFKVDWVGYSVLPDSWVVGEALQAFEPVTFEPGVKVNIQWGEDWYPGRVIRNALGLCLAHYSGYPSVDDEWVPPHRLRLR